MSSAVDGFAVWIDNRIDIRTVSDTKQAAMVNFLVTTARIMVSNATTAEVITAKFNSLAPHYGAVLVPVTVNLKPK